MDANYRDLTEFRFWCFKVLPLVYDDELSYYEVICKCVDYINNLIENDKAISNDVEKLKQEMKKVQVSGSVNCVIWDSMPLSYLTQL